MKAMSSQLTSPTLRAGLLAIAAMIATASVTAAEADKKSEEVQAETEKKLEDARRRLDEAAREVAELSMSRSMSDPSIPWKKTMPFNQRQHSMLGVNIGPPGAELPDGVAVISVSPGAGAESAGLKAGDVLLSINGKALKRDGDLSARDVLMAQMREVKPGDKVDLRYRRDNKVATAKVVARAPIDRMYSMMPLERGHMSGGGPYLLPQIAMMRAAGVFGSTELVPLTPKLGQYFGTDKGLLVVRAPTDSRLKLEEGDVILDIGGRTPANPTHAFRILGSYQPGEQLKLNVLRQKKRLSFEITVPTEPSASLAAPFTFDDETLIPPGMGPGITDHFFISPGPPPPPLPPGEAGVTRKGEDGVTIKKTIIEEDEPA